MPSRDFKLALLGTQNAMGYKIDLELLQKMAHDANATRIYVIGVKGFNIGYADNWKVQEGLLVATVHIFEEDDLPFDKIPTIWYEATIGENGDSLGDAKIVELRLSGRMIARARIVE